MLYYILNTTNWGWRYVIHLIMINLINSAEKYLTLTITHEKDDTK